MTGKLCPYARADILWARKSLGILDGQLKLPFPQLASAALERPTSTK